MNTHPLRVMVVDDNPVVAERLAELLSENPRIDVCDRVESGLLAFARIAADRPDVVLMDLEMPGIGGLAAMRRIKALLGPPAIVVVTLHDSETMRREAAAAGADAFVPKSRVTEDLLPTLEALFPSQPEARGEAAA
jgi:DNA-binding NarL/FixJ family response regulator